MSRFSHPASAKASPATTARPPRTLARRVVAMTAALVLAALGTLGSPTMAKADDAGKLLLVLDSSGSMKEKAGDGKTRMEAAKTALTTVVDSLDGKTTTGLRVYGAKVFDKNAGDACSDSQLVVPLGTNNKDALKKAISGFKPYGETPISYALEQAGKDVGGSGQRSIVLISDGEETCSTNPCVAAQKLANQGIDVRIDVVGFDVAGKAKQQLQCVAKVGRGEYSDVKDTRELTERLNQAKKRASEPFEISGTPVEGSTDQKKPAPISAGTWTDTMPAPGQSKFYRLDRTIKRSTFWAGLTMSPKLSGDKNFAFASMRIAPVDENEYARCGTAYPYAWSSGERSAGMMTGRVTSAGKSTEDIKTCQEQQLMLELKATKGSDAPDLSKQKFQMNLFEEPPAKTDGLPNAVTDAPVDWQNMKHGKAAGVQAATSLAKAPTVKPGTYTFDIAPGEFRVVKVPVEWGQRLQAFATSPKITHYKDNEDRMELRVLPPLGGDAKTRVKDAPYSTLGSTWGEIELGISTQEVRYANRNKPEGDISAAGMAGDFYVVLTLTSQKTSPNQAIPMTVTIATIGKANGAPAYEEPEPIGPSEDPSASPSEEPTDEGTDDPSADPSESGQGSAEPTQSAPADKPAEESGSGKNWPLIGGLTVFGLALGGFSVWYANRTRRRP